MAGDTWRGLNWRFSFKALVYNVDQKKSSMESTPHSNKIKNY